MRRLMGFSYKGGSGRSTALANIAVALAKHNKRVLVIDYDTQAPGLHILYRVATPGYKPDPNTTQIPPAPPGILDYLVSDEPPEDAIKDRVVDLVDVCYNSFYKDKFKELPGEIHFLPGVSNSPGVDHDNPRLGSRLSAFIDYLDDNNMYDYVCIDSPSGINARSEHVFDVSQLILMFYRWSHQHVEGTEIMMRYLNEYIQNEQLGNRTYEIIGNAVPDDKVIRRDTNDEDSQVLLGHKKHVTIKLTDILKEQYEIEQKLYCNTPFGDNRRKSLENLPKDKAQRELHYIIPEDPMMKLIESPITLFKDDTKYEEIAKDLLSNKILAPGEE